MMLERINLNEEVFTLYAIDGQHRLMGIKGLHSFIINNY